MVGRSCKEKWGARIGRGGARKGRGGARKGRGIARKVREVQGKVGGKWCKEREGGVQTQ